MPYLKWLQSYAIFWPLKGPFRTTAFILFIIENNDYIYTISRIEGNEDIVLISVQLFCRLFKNGIIKQSLPLCEGNMTICSPSTGNIVLWLRPRAIIPASGEQIVMLPLHKGKGIKSRDQMPCTFVFIRNTQNGA